MFLTVLYSVLNSTKFVLIPILAIISKEEKTNLKTERILSNIL